MCSKPTKISSSSAMKGCSESYHYIAGEETEALRCHEVFLRSQTNQYRARGKSWVLALCIKHWVNNLSLFISGVLIHSYHQWVMTQSHCSSVSWSFNAKWAFSNSVEPNGWVQIQMPARGLWGAIPPPDYPLHAEYMVFPSVWFLHWQQASTSCCEREAMRSWAQQHQWVQAHAQLKPGWNE